MNEAFVDYFRCPEGLARFSAAHGFEDDATAGFFRFGAGVTCFGRLAGVAGDSPEGAMPDVANQAKVRGNECVLPFDPTEVATNFRWERYVQREDSRGWKKVTQKVYYALRPLFPVAVRRHLQRVWLKGWDKKPFPRWPVDRSVDQMFERLMALTLKTSGMVRIPFIWFWPEGKSACATMTHDVETETGLRFSDELMNINDSFEIKSSFQVIPCARYVVQESDLSHIRGRGFEVNVHDHRHDGHLFDDRQGFLKAAVEINEAGIRFGSKGFRAAILYRNQEWFDALDFSYDMSVPNVAHLDPQRGGCCTVMPYFVGKILEIPVTATQDYTLFHVLGTYSMDLWREQIDLILEQHGLISFIIHPDYLSSPEARGVYTDLLASLSRLRDELDVWLALPGEIDTWWRSRSKMHVVPDGSGWRIEGPGSERAVLAYATLQGDQVRYEFN